MINCSSEVGYTVGTIIYCGATKKNYEVIKCGRVFIGGRFKYALTIWRIL